MATPDLDDRRALDAIVAGHDPTTDGRNAAAVERGRELMAAWQAEDAETVVIDLRARPGEIEAPRPARRRPALLRRSGR